MAEEESEVERLRRQCDEAVNAINTMREQVSNLQSECYYLKQVVVLEREHAQDVRELWKHAERERAVEVAGQGEYTLALLKTLRGDSIESFSSNFARILGYVLDGYKEHLRHSAGGEGDEDVEEDELADPDPSDDPDDVDALRSDPPEA